jgi:hypothetical protein
LQILPNVYCNRYSTLLAPANEALIPPELLSSKTVWTPDRELGMFLVYDIHFAAIIMLFLSSNLQTILFVSDESVRF